MPWPYPNSLALWIPAYLVVSVLALWPSSSSSTVPCSFMLQHLYLPVLLKWVFFPSSVLSLSDNIQLKFYFSWILSWSIQTNSASPLHSKYYMTPLHDCTSIVPNNVLIWIIIWLIPTIILGEEYLRQDLKNELRPYEKVDFTTV